MKRFGLRIVSLGLACVCASWTAADAQKPAYLDPSLPPEQRAADLVHRMTLEEKASQLVNQARAIPRLNIPAYDWWSESLHGVAVNGTTEFPEPIGLGATFDTDAIHQMAIAISTEGPHQARTGPPCRPQQHLRGARFLGAQHQHFSRSALGPRPGNIR